MTNFTTVQEWLKSKPTEQEISKVLELVNRSSKREMKQALWNKTKELNRLSKFSTEMNELGFKVSQEVVDKTSTIVKEIDELKESIGPVVKRTKKEEIKKEE
jgi:hypothetical protein